MRGFTRKKILTVAIGGLLGAVLAPTVVYFFGAMGMMGIPAPVTKAMVQSFEGLWVALVVQSLLGGLFGAIVATACLPFADEGKELLLRSLIHFVATALSFSALLWVCRWGETMQGILVWVAILALLYALIWLGRWIGWYLEVAQLRTLLGLAPGPSPLKWRETLPYLPFALLTCSLVPVCLFWVDRTFAELPVLSGLVLPFLLLPVAGFFSGLSLGKRQGVCLLYPLACFVCYLPLVYVLFNPSALFHCFMVAVPALVGNVLGWLYRRAVPKKKEW